MLIVNVHEAKINLSKLIERAVDGESVVIARAGKPLVKVVALAQADIRRPRVGFLKDEVSTPDDFDDMGQEVTEQLFSLAR